MFRGDVFLDLPEHITNILRFHREHHYLTVPNQLPIGSCSLNTTARDKGLQLVFVNIECFYLTATVKTPLHEMKPVKMGDLEPSKDSRRGSRRSFWSALGEEREAPVFAFELLKPGNTMQGPALIEAKDTTFVIEPGWRFTLDPYFNGLLERA